MAFQCAQPQISFFVTTRRPQGAMDLPMIPLLFASPSGPSKTSRHLCSQFCSCYHFYDNLVRVQEG